MSGLPNEEHVDQHLQLSAFKGKFDVPSFIGSISEKLIAHSKADNGPFKPKPFLSTFEAAVDKLIALRKEVQTKTEQMEKSVRVSEREYSKRMVDLNRGFEAVNSSFSGMESRMNEVSTTAVRIGEQLEMMHIERQRAQAAYDLIELYGSFAKGDTTKLDALRKEGRNGRRQVAVLLRRLSTVAKEVDLPSADKTRENIEKYCEKFEKEMLSLFDRCYRKGDPKMMHHCAQTLLEFNGGSSCVQVYVNQHDFFINEARNARPVEDTLLWSTVSDQDTTPPKSEVGLSNLFNEIRATVETEAQIVKAVFPNPPIVMQVFLQRVFAQPVQQHLEMLLHRGSAISDLAYLRVLQLAHSQTSALVEDLKVYELPHVSPRTSVESSEFRRTMTGSAGITPINVNAISTMLEAAMEELFTPYTEGQRYLERECKSVAGLYTHALTDFTRYHERMQKLKSSMFDRMVNQLSAAAASSAPAGTSTSAQAAAALMRIGGINTERSHERTNEEPVREEDGVLDIVIGEKILKWHAEAIGRCVELSLANDVPKNTFSLLRVLAEAIGNAYMGTALETAQVRLEGADTRAEPNLQILSIIRSVDLICHLWQQYVNIVLFPLASSSVTVRREMVSYNNQSINRLETTTNQLLQRLIDVIIVYLSAQLTKQKRNDFKPRNDDLSFARVNTEPCVACCETLEKVRDVTQENLSGKNLEAFLTEIGVAFHSLLLEHLRKFPVNPTGGLMLAKDIKSYQDVINSFGIVALRERFEFIRQLGNVFLVRPETIKSYISENQLGRIDINLLKPYLALRSDWGQFEKAFNEGGGLTDVHASPSEGRGLKERFGRLSVMMKDLEHIRLADNIPMGIPSIPTSINIPTSITNSFTLTARTFSG
ncbi:hypothetical protein M378DRAFT_117200 [Amanita muscaria Koide BX008]|uniref:Uncharacterized protein n=1 Tax=Amanita muscaria (strain Koide BX008) TaxID=946122 RepID=A0A0C2XM56_AMAMK|nr:hypothetical protein M378DRAFT_117200 [Amanita muscaria Koide BX008]